MVVFSESYYTNAMQDKPDTHSRIDEIELSDKMADVLAGMVPTNGQPSTLADVMDPAEEWLPPEGTISVSAMYQDGETRHAVHLADGTKYVPCILDALIVSLVTSDDPVRIESTSPANDTVIEYQISDGVVDVTPQETVVSFGVAPVDAHGIQYGDDFEDNARVGSCSYINSFPDEGAYDQWAGETDAVAVMKLSVDEAVTVARRMAESELFETE